MSVETIAEADEKYLESRVNTSIKNFDVEAIVDNFSLALYGARRRGKSVLLHYIISKVYKRFDEAFLFSNTSELQGNIWHFIPKENRIKGLDEGKLNDILKRAMDKRREIEDRFSDGDQVGKDKALDRDMSRVLVILDDIVSDKRTQRSSILDEYFTLGRHAYLSVAILSQNASARASLSISARGNLDVCMTTAMNQLDDTERLSRYYFGIEGWKNGMQRIVDLTSTPYSFAVSDMQLQDKKGRLDTYTSKITAPPFENHDKNFLIGSVKSGIKHNGLSSNGKGIDKIPVFKEGISRLYDAELADGGSVSMILPGSSHCAVIDEKNIITHDGGLRGKRRKFTSGEDFDKNSKLVIGVDDLEYENKKDVINWECEEWPILDWDGHEICF